MFAHKKNRIATKMAMTAVVALSALVLLAPGATAQGALDASSATRFAGEGNVDASGAMSLVDDTLAEAQQVAAQADGALKHEIDVNAALEAEAPVKTESAADAGVGFVATVKGYMDGFFQKVQSFKGYFMGEAESTHAEVQAEADAQVQGATDAALNEGERLIGEAEGALATTQYTAASMEYEAHAQVDASSQYAAESITHTGYGLIGEAEGAVASTQGLAGSVQYDAEANLDASTNAIGTLEAPQVPRPSAPSPWVGLTSSLQAALTGLIQLGGVF